MNDLHNRLSLVMEELFNLGVRGFHDRHETKRIRILNSFCIFAMMLTLAGITPHAINVITGRVDPKVLIDLGLYSTFLCVSILCLVLSHKGKHNLARL